MLSHFITLYKDIGASAALLLLHQRAESHQGPTFVFLFVLSFLISSHSLSGPHLKVTARFPFNILILQLPRSLREVVPLVYLYNYQSSHPYIDIKRFKFTDKDINRQRPIYTCIVISNFHIQQQLNTCNRDCITTNIKIFNDFCCTCVRKCAHMGALTYKDISSFLFMLSGKGCCLFVSDLQFIGKPVPRNRSQDP